MKQIFTIGLVGCSMIIIRGELVRLVEFEKKIKNVNSVLVDIKSNVILLLLDKNVWWVSLNK